VAKRKTLFDDKSTEISELIYVIKHDIAELNNDIGNLQAFAKQKRGNARVAKGKKGSELNEHNDNVVVLLQSKLADTSMGFKEVLEIRTQVYILHLSRGFVTDGGLKNMKASKDRSEQFVSVLTSQTPPPGTKHFMLQMG
jgi:syntaxin 5